MQKARSSPSFSPACVLPRYRYDTIQYYCRRVDQIPFSPALTTPTSTPPPAPSRASSPSPSSSSSTATLETGRSAERDHAGAKVPEPKQSPRPLLNGAIRGRRRRRRRRGTPRRARRLRREERAPSWRRAGVEAPPPVPDDGRYGCTPAESAGVCPTG